MNIFRQIRVQIACFVRGHSPDPRTLKGSDPYEAECYFCRALLEWSPGNG